MLKRIKNLFYDLPLTSTGLFALLLLPSIGLLFLKDHFSLIPAEQEQRFLWLMTRMNLLQSFEGDSQRSPPRLWQERLGINMASEIWRRQGRGIWWQAWADDGEAYLIVPAIIWPIKSNPLVAAYHFGDLVAIGSNALHRQQLIQGLEQQPVKQSISTSDLQRYCKSVLKSGPALMWRPAGLAAISGSMASILQFSRFGCLSLSSDQNKLSWQGVVGLRSLASAPAFVSAEPSRHYSVSYDLPSKSDSEQILLRLSAKKTDLLFGSLLSKKLIQNSLETYYDLQPASRLKLASAPFSLILHKQLKGTFKASLQMQFALPEGPSKWKPILKTIGQRLENRGFIKDTKAVTKNSQNINGDLFDMTLWRQHQDDSVVGGWAWQQQNGELTILNIALGAAPYPALIINQSMPPLGGDVMRFSADTAGLNRLGLLDGRWPSLVKQAGEIGIKLNSLPGIKSDNRHWWWMSGQLRLEPASRP